MTTTRPTRPAQRPPQTPKPAPTTPVKPAPKPKPAPKEYHVTYTITVDLAPQVGGRAPTRKALLEQAQAYLGAFPADSKGRVAVAIRDRRGAQRRQVEERRRARQRKQRRAAATPECNTAALDPRRA